MAGRHLAVVQHGRAAVPAGRTPARQTLADRVAELNALNVETANIRAARDDANERRFVSFRQAEEAAEAVERAKDEEVAYQIAQVSGDGQKPPLTLKEARAALAEAEDERQRAARVYNGIEQRLGECGDRRRSAELYVDKAVLEVVRTDPRTLALFERYFAARDEFLRLYRTMRGVGSGSLPAGWSDVRFDVGMTPDALAWRDAIARLATDPDALLPESP